MVMPLTNPHTELYPDRLTDRRHLWVVFRATNIYRLVLAVLLLAAFAIDEQNRLFGKLNPAVPGCGGGLHDAGGGRHYWAVSGGDRD